MTNRVFGNSKPQSDCRRSKKALGCNYSSPFVWLSGTGDSTSPGGTRLPEEEFRFVEHQLFSFDFGEGRYFTGIASLAHDSLLIEMLGPAVQKRPEKALEIWILISLWFLVSWGSSGMPLMLLSIHNVIQLLKIVEINQLFFSYLIALAQFRAFSLDSTRDSSISVFEANVTRSSHSVCFRCWERWCTLGHCC